MKAIIVTLVVIASLITGFLTDAAASWTTESDGTLRHNEGPVAVDLNNDGNKEFLVSNPQSIRIFGSDGNEWANMELTIVDELPPAPYNNPDNPDNDEAHYRIYSIAAAGDINSDGHPDVVAVCWAHYVRQDPPNNCDVYFYKVYCWIAQFNNDQLTGFTPYSYGTTNSLGACELPILFDLDQNGDYEIFVLGPGETANGILRVFSEVFDFSNNLIAPIGGFADDAVQNVEEARFAVADLEGDGIADLVYVSRSEDSDILHCKTITSAGVVNDKDGFPLTMDVDYFDVGRCDTYGGGITLADFNRDGNLEINVPVSVIDAGLNPNCYPTVIIYSRTGARLAWFPKQIQGVNPAPNQAIWSGTPALFDFNDEGRFHYSFTSTSVDEGTGRLFAIQRNDQGVFVNHPNWNGGKALAGDNCGNYSSVVANVVSDFAGVDIGVFEDLNDDNQDGNGQLRGYDVNDGSVNPENIGDRIEYAGASATAWKRETVPAIGYFDGDNNIDVAYNADGFLRFATVAGQNPGMENIEWSQFQNGPTHQSVYASVYHGTPYSATDWQTVRWAGRIYVSGNLSFTANTTLWIERGTVVEFANDVSCTLPYATYFESNPAGGSPDLAHNGATFKSDRVGDHYTLTWSERPTLVGTNLNFYNGGLVIPGGGHGRLKHCTFEGAGATYAIQGSSASDIRLDSCIISGYQTAVYTSNSTDSIRNCSIDSCTSSAFSLTGSLGIIDGCTIDHSTSTAISLTNCNGTGGLTIKNTSIKHSVGPAIYMSNSNPTLTNVNAYYNNCGSLGAAIYSYNSSPHFRDCDVDSNLYAGFIASGGGSPAFTTYNLLDPHRNRFRNNNRATHTPRADSTWAEVIQKLPSYIGLDYGHNDIVNNPGDYLVSNHGYPLGYTLYARNNYWVTPVSLDPTDFFRNGSVMYLPNDLVLNHLDDANDEEAAYNLFTAACIEADSGAYGQAYSDFRQIVASYPATTSALPSISKIKECGLASDVSLAVLRKGA